MLLFRTEKNNIYLVYSQKNGHNAMSAWDDTFLHDPIVYNNIRTTSDKNTTVNEPRKMQSHNIGVI